MIALIPQSNNHTPLYTSLLKIPRQQYENPRTDRMHASNSAPLIRRSGARNATIVVTIAASKDGRHRSCLSSIVDAPCRSRFHRKRPPPHGRSSLSPDEPKKSGRNSHGEPEGDDDDIFFPPVIGGPESESAGVRGIRIGRGGPEMPPFTIWPNWMLLPNQIDFPPMAPHDPLVAGRKQNSPVVLVTHHPPAHAQQQKPDEETADDPAAFHARIVPQKRPSWSFASSVPWCLKLFRRTRPLPPTPRQKKSKTIPLPKPNKNRTILPCTSRTRRGEKIHAINPHTPPPNPAPQKPPLTSPTIPLPSSPENPPFPNLCRQQHDPLRPTPPKTLLFQKQRDPLRLAQKSSTLSPAPPPPAAP